MFIFRDKESRGARSKWHCLCSVEPSACDIVLLWVILFLLMLLSSFDVVLLAEWWNYFFFGSGKQKLFLLQSRHDQESLVDSLDLVHDNIGSVPC
jgi:hypothetical protein